jgi:hypothetical protein
MVTFVALDYRAPENIRYAYKMTGDADWHFLHSNHSITLPELAPGTYHLLLRSTNAEGRWADNTRTLTIVVKPRFVETVWFVLLMVFLLLGLVAAVLCTISISGASNVSNANAGSIPHAARKQQARYRRQTQEARAYIGSASRREVVTRRRGVHGASHALCPATHR